MAELTFDNILDDDFTLPDVEEKQETSPENEEIENTITEVDSLDFDSDDLPESVGDEEDIEEKEDADNSKSQGTSPITFSSIAEAFAEEGIFPDLEQEDIESAKTAEDFVNLVNKQIQAKLDETQKRINDALNAGVETDVIKSYENTIGYLNNITSDAISEESADGEMLRKKLIYQDLINKGISQERAVKMTQRSVENGTDVEDAKDALASNIEYFGAKYNEVIRNAQKEVENAKANRDKQAAELKKSILNDEKIFGDFNVDKATRQKIYENISKPVYRNKDTGDVYTAIQKYEMDNPNDFLKYVSMCYTLTDGFTQMGKLVGGAVKKETKSKMKALEHTLNNTARTSDGKLDFLSGIHDPESSSSKFKLDI